MVTACAVDSEELYKSAFRGTSKMLVLLRVSESGGTVALLTKRVTRGLLVG